MSTTKVSALAELTTADATDVLLITDVSAAQSKKIQKSNITQENFTTTLKNKLDGIEPAATADQTAQEIATAIDADATAEATLKSALGLGTAAYTASTDYATAAHNHAGVYEPADATILKDADIGVNVQAYNANLVTYATNGNTAYGWGDHGAAGYLTSFTETDPVVGAITGIVKANGAGTISAAIASTDYTVPSDIANMLETTDIGSTVQAYDADTAKYDDVTANFTGTLQNGGSNVVVDSDIGSTVVGSTFTGDVDITGELVVDSYNESYAAVTSSSGALTIDCEAGNNFSLALSENVSSSSFSNPPTTGTAYGFVLKVVQDSTDRTITWPSSVDWPAATAPTLSSGSGAVDVFVFYTHDGGTTWYGFTAGQALA